MPLSDIAEGLEITTRQRNRGVATVDDTDATLSERLSAYESDLPCDPVAAATVIETHTAGNSVGDSAQAAGVEPVIAAKALHLLGVSGINPLGPMSREIVRDWLAGGIARSEAVALTGGNETEFALAAFIETHDPIDGATAAIEGAFEGGERSTQKRDLLADTMTDAGEFQK